MPDVEPSRAEPKPPAPAVASGRHVSLGARPNTPAAKTVAGASFDNSVGKIYSARKDSDEPEKKRFGLFRKKR